MKVKNYCFCNESEKVEDISSIEVHQQKSGLYYFTELDFGTVAVGTTATKSVFIENDTKQTQIYHFQRKSESRITHYDFDCVMSKNKVIHPNQTFQCKVVFRPAYTNETSFRKFIIVDGSQNYHVILAKGESVGPNVHASVKKLNFYIIKDYTHKKNTFEITNNSSAETVYQLELGSDVFFVNNVKGPLPANGRVFVTIQFDPKVKGIYHEHLWCLLLNQEPVSVELIGIYRPKTKYNITNLVLKHYPIPLQYRTGNHGYFGNSSLENFVPPVTLKPNHLFFNKVTELAFTVKNNSDDEIRIIWLQDENRIFKIVPEEFIIPPKLYLKFKCQFTPKAENEIYSKNVTAQINWYCNLLQCDHSTVGMVDSNEQIIYLPFSQSLKCTAHSFSEHSRWISTAQVIPGSVKLPACIGATKSWATFQLKSKCGLPILFNILPPQKTNLIMKPMTGLIEPTSLQIISVQFNPPSTETLSMNEKWYISLNGQSDNLLPVSVTYQCDIPSMIVGENNVIKFPCIQVGWKECLHVLLRNTSSFQIKYTLICDTNQYIEIETPEGYIGCNQEYFIKMYFTGDICAPTKSYITCKCEAVQKHLLVGKPAETKVVVYAQCSYSQLCALPKEINFREVEWGALLETNFMVYNFGTATINFILRTPEAGRDRITIEPNNGKIRSHEKICVALKLKVMEIGPKSIEFFYELPGCIGSSIRIFTLSYSSSYPTFQITEIISHSFNMLFNKARLWELLNIPELNEILQTIQQDEEHTLNCFLPEYEHNHHSHSIKFLLWNNTKFNVGLSLQKVKMCACELIEIESLTFRKKVFDCPHRDLLSINVSQTEIRPNCKEILTFKLKYSEMGNNKICYLVKLSHNRRIRIFIEINSICDEICTLSTYKPSCFMNLQEVYIGASNPPLQCFWLYNNSSNGVTYHVDDLKLIKMCSSDGFNVLTCFNPVDEVKAYSYSPIVFHFHPIEVKEYRVSIPLLLGDRLVELKICGKGIAENKQLLLTDHSMPTSSKTFMDSSVSISVDEITIEGIPLWNGADRIIFMKNNSKNRKYHYYWVPYHLEGIVYVDMEARTGVLYPRETKKVLIKICTMGEPSVTNLILSCVLDLDQNELHGKVKQNSEDCFIGESTDSTGTESVGADKKIYIALGLNLEIVDITESLFHRNLDDILRNKPIKLIELDRTNIMQKYIDSMSKTDHPIEFNMRKYSDTDQNEDNSENELNDTAESKGTKATPLENIDDHAVEAIKDTMTKLIGQVVFSNLFKKIIESDENNFSIYYCQYKISGQRSEHGSGPSKHVKLTQQRIKETKKFLNHPAPKELSDTLQHLLNETVDILFSNDSEHSNLVIPQ